MLNAFLKIKTIKEKPARLLFLQPIGFSLCLAAKKKKKLGYAHPSPLPASERKFPL
jgi:hypothetical protein